MLHHQTQHHHQIRQWQQAKDGNGGCSGKGRGATFQCQPGQHAGRSLYRHDGQGDSENKTMGSTWAQYSISKHGLIFATLMAMASIQEWRLSNYRNRWRWWWRWRGRRARWRSKWPGRISWHIAVSSATLNVSLCLASKWWRLETASPGNYSDNA